MLLYENGALFRYDGARVFHVMSSHTSLAVIPFTAQAYGAVVTATTLGSMLNRNPRQRHPTLLLFSFFFLVLHSTQLLNIVSIITQCEHIHTSV